MRRENVDVCVIGSGAGGSVAAYEAAKRGLRTIVLERGPETRVDEMTHDELAMIPWLYKDGGLTMNTSLDMFILQGSCVGGSTVLSNMVLLRPDDEALAPWGVWGEPLGLASMHRAFDEIERELGAAHAVAQNVAQSTVRFREGALALGRRPEWMMKALGDCRGCGYCNVGCAFGTKRSAETTYLHWAREHGARVLAHAEVTDVVCRAGEAREVRAQIGRAKDPLRVKARLVVVAAGAIGSSALLLASGVRKNVGTKLSFNAGSMVAARYGDIVDGHDGDQMTVYLKGDGYLVEATHNPMMSAALTTPGWFADHGRLMSHSRNLGYAGALVGTEATGRVVLSPFFGHEEVRFKLTSGDFAKLKRGVRGIAEIFFAAGASEVILPTHKLRSIRSPRDLSAIDQIRSTREISFGSAHPQGGNPLSADPDVGVVNEELAVHGMSNLFVCDASVFPSCIGVNPIETILAVAKLAAPRIMARA